MDPKTKLIGASALAVVALGLAGWLAYRSMGGGRSVRSASQATSEQEPRGAPGELSAEPPGEGAPREVMMDGPPPKWMQIEQDSFAEYQGEFEFPSKADAIEAFDTGTEDLVLVAEQDEALGTLGVGARRGLIESWRRFMRPLLAADAEAFEQAVADLGGVTDAGESGQTGASSLFGMLSGYFEDSRVAMSAARIVERDPMNRREVPAAPSMKMPPGMSGNAVMIPMMVDVMQGADDAPTIRNMNVPLGSLFPDAAALAAEGATTMEVWAPAKLAGVGGKKADIGPSVFFVLDRDRNAWQPVAMRVALVSDKAASELDDMMKNARRRSVDD